MRLESLEERARANGNSLDGQWLKENELREIKYSNGQSSSFNSQDDNSRISLENFAVIDEEDIKNREDSRRSLGNYDGSMSLKDAFEKSLENILSSADDRENAISDLEKAKSLLEQQLRDSGFYDDENEISHGRNR